MTKFFNRFSLSTIIIYFTSSLISNSLIIYNWTQGARWCAAIAWFLAFVISSLATYGETIEKGKQR